MASCLRAFHHGGAQLGAGFAAGFLQQVVHVEFHGALRYEQVGGYLGVAEAVFQQREDLALAG